MTQRLLLTFSNKRQGAIVLMASVACLFLGWVFLAGPKLQPDDWRRTANGWERNSHWQASAAASDFRDSRVGPATKGPRAGRIDTHPAVLALMQLVGALLALYAFPPRSSPSWLPGGRWSALLAESFQASAFG
jgi:hypothetical protein